MNWDEVGAIGQVLGSIAVFITLGYLATQVRHARQDARRSLSQGRAEAHRDLLAQAREERISKIQQKAQAALGAPLHPSVTALMEEAGLTREEAEVLNALQTAWWTYHLQIIPYVDELQAMERTAFENQVRGKWGSGEGRVYWDTYIKHAAHTDAVRYIGELLARPAGAAS